MTSTEGPSAHDQSGFEARAQRRREAWSGLGIKIPNWRNENEAPPLELDLLNDAIAGRLSAEVQQRVDWLTIHFHSWAEAYCNLAAAEFRRAHPMEDQSTK